MFASAGWSRSVRSSSLIAAALLAALAVAHPARADEPGDGDDVLWAGDDAWSDPVQPASADGKVIGEPAGPNSGAPAPGYGPAAPGQPPAPGNNDRWSGDDNGGAGQGAPSTAAPQGPNAPLSDPPYATPGAPQNPTYGAPQSPTYGAPQSPTYGGAPQPAYPGAPQGPSYPGETQPAPSYPSGDPLPPSSYGGGYDPQNEVQATAPRYADFQSGLSPYGMWVDTPEYGRVFRPTRVSTGWRPYLDGRWVYTRYGWTWASDEPFGWATYHYGRWWYSGAYGWTWVPGRVWAPAWVSWRYGGGNCGWAPMGPRGLVYVEPTRWVIVPSVHFVHPVRTYALPVHQTYAVWSRVTPLPMVRPGPLSGPRVTVISSAVGRPISVVPIRSAPSQATAGRVHAGGGLEIFRPRGVPFRAAAVQARVRRDFPQQPASPQAGPRQPTVPLQPHANAPPFTPHAGQPSTPQAGTPHANAPPFTPHAGQPLTPQAGTPHSNTPPFTPHAGGQPSTSQANPPPFTPRASTPPFTPHASTPPFTPRAGSPSSPQSSTPPNRWGSEAPRATPRERPQWGQPRPSSPQAQPSQPQPPRPSGGVTRPTPSYGSRPTPSYGSRPAPSYGSRPTPGNPRPAPGYNRSPTTRDRTTAAPRERSRSSGSTAAAPKSTSRSGTAKKRD